MITRRCHDRRLFLTPSGDPKRGHTTEETTNFYGYTVGRSVALYRMDFHGGTQMGNHHHNNVTDPLGLRPNYKNSMHGNLARGLNARFGRFDSVWASGGSCDTVTPSDDETLEDLVYTDCNPVMAGVVKWAHQWPGFTTYGWRFGESRTFRRPGWYFDPDNPNNPPEVTLTRKRPDIFPELTDDALFDKLMNRCGEIQVAKQRDMKAKHRRFMGLRKLAKSKWWAKPTSWEDRYTIVPTVASSSKEKRIRELKRNAQWRARYANERARLRNGEPALLPYGAYFLPTVYGVPVEAKPP